MLQSIQRLSEKSGNSKKASDLIAKRRQVIEKLNTTRRKRLQQIQRQLEKRGLSPCIDEQQIYIEGQTIQRPKTRRGSRTKSKQPYKSSPMKQKNEGVGDLDKMTFQKKFKSYLNHKQEFLEKARRRQQAIREKRKRQRDGQKNVDDYFNQQQILSNTGSDYQYKDADQMQQAYQILATGKRRRKGGVQLFYAEKFQFAYRLMQFENILNIMQDPSRVLVSKQRLLEHLFNQPMLMMLYSINPYQVADQIADYQTQEASMLTFEQFSLFLLTDREPTYFEYTQENLQEARRIGRGLKCAPIVGKWIDQTGIYEDFIDIFNSVDMFGNDKAERFTLARKLTVQCQKKRILDYQVVQIVNINKLVPVSRLIYEIEHELGASQMIHRHQFQQFLLHYHRLPTPDKDKLVTKLIMAGKYDTSYIYIVSQEVLEFIKQVFNQMQKFAQYFVKKQKFVEKITKNKKYAKLKNYLVRSQSNRYVQKETVEQTLIRFLSQADFYVDIQEILDFFSNRGRPRLIQYHVYLANLERQLQIIQEQQLEKLKIFQQTGEQPSTSSDQQFERSLKVKKINRKKQKLANIRGSLKYDYKKKFNVTIPVKFGFEQREKHKKSTIRQRKLKQMLDEEKRIQQQSLKPIPIRQVPKYVKQPLYQKMMKDQQRQRKQRLQRFKLQIQNSMVPMPERLTKPLDRDIHCDFGRQPYQFVARPMPWYCQVNLLQRINKQKQQRRQKILQQIINRHHDNDLPQGVLRMLQRHEQIQQKRLQKNTASTTNVGAGQCTFIPRISHNIPDFKAIHERLQFDLENAKGQNKNEHFHPAPFSFQNRQHKTRSHLHCVPSFDRKPSHIKQYIPDDNQVQIKSTLKYKSLVEKRRSQRQAKQRQILKQQQNEQKRKMRQEKFAPIVRRALQRNQNTLGKSRQQMLQRIKQFQKQQKKKARQYQNKMIDIYTKVWNRPLLIQNNEFGQNDIKKNPRLSDIQNQPHHQNLVQKNKPKQGVQKEKEKDSRRRNIDQNYEQKRRKAIQQPPGQYLIEQDEQKLQGMHGHGRGHFEGHGMQDGTYEEDDNGQFQDQFLQNSGLRTS